MAKTLLEALQTAEEPLAWKAAADMAEEVGDASAGRWRRLARLADLTMPLWVGLSGKDRGEVEPFACRPDSPHVIYFRRCTKSVEVGRRLRGSGRRVALMRVPVRRLPGFGMYPPAPDEEPEWDYLCPRLRQLANILEREGIDF